jgi:hypothetical protein
LYWRKRQTAKKAAIQVLIKALAMALQHRLLQEMSRATWKLISLQVTTLAVKVTAIKVTV